MEAEETTGGSTLLEEQRDLARSRIVRAARRALADTGLDTTVDDVAAAAGVSRRTVFRHFVTRERLFAAAIREGLQAYAEHLPADRVGEDPAAWLTELLVATHRMNARNGRVYWELSALGPQLTGELAVAAAERREARKRFAARITGALWRARNGQGRPPRWLTDAVAVHLSGFTTQSLAGDFDRTPDEVAHVSCRVLMAALDAAIIERG